MRFEELLDRHEWGDLTQAEAGEMLGVSERTFLRWRDRYREEGAPGLGDRRIGKPSPRRAPESELARARALYAEMYGGFTAKHFHEHLQARHGYRLGYTVTRLALQAAGLVRRAPRRGAHRRKRPRRPLPGMLLHQDAARHAWLAGRPPLDLVVTLDDATNAVYSGILVAEEGTASSLRALAEVVADRGMFCALYTDRGSHYFHTRRPAAASTGSTRPRSAGRWRSSASSTSPPIRRRRAVARSGRSAPWRTGCPRSWRWPGSPGSTRPTPGCASTICPRTTPASRWRPSRTVPPSCRWRRRSGARCSASRTSARSATTTPCTGRDAVCRSRRARSGPTSPARACGCTNTPTARSRCSGGRTASPTSRLPRRTSMTWRRDPLRRRQRCGQRCRVAHTTTTTEADNRCAT